METLALTIAAAMALLFMAVFVFRILFKIGRWVLYLSCASLIVIGILWKVTL